MSDTPEEAQRQEQQQQHAPPREESALPVAAPISAAPISDFKLKQRTTLRIVGTTIVLSIVMSAVLEYGGWQRAFMDMPAPHAPIPPLSFLRGVWDTTLGAIGVGVAGALGALLLPSTWRKSWRRVPAAFVMGAVAFLGFLSFVTFDFMR